MAYNLNKLNTTTGAGEKIDYLLTSKIISEKAFVLCWFIPLRKWRKKLRNYYRNL